MKNIVVFLCWFLFAVPCFSQGGRKSTNTSTTPAATSSAVSSEDGKATALLNSVLSNYRNKNIQLKVKKTFRVPVIDQISREEGSLHLQRGGRFRYFMSSPTANQLMIFDGRNLWYQPDIGEKTVFQLSSHPQWRLLSSLFDSQRFFQFFSVEKFEKTAEGHTFHLKPRQDMTDIQKIVLKTNRYIKEIQVLWNGVDHWQKYHFSNPWVKKYFPESLFVFNTQGFEVISQVQKK